MDSMAYDKDVGTKENTVLQLLNISKIYPGTVALYKINLEARKGEVHGIIGKNGAGKSTLVGIIAGIISPTSGEMFVNGKRIKILSRVIAKKEKISIVPQDPQVILDFTVAENLFMGNSSTKSKLINWKELFLKAEQVFKKVNLKVDVRAKARDLSVSEQQMLLVLKACFVEDANIIILDEASASLSQHDEQILHQIIKERKQEGKTILYISHRTDELLKVCDRVTVLRDGRSVATKNCNGMNKETLSSLIVGEGFKLGSVRRDNNFCREEGGEAALVVDNLTKFGVFKNINFTLRKGEILGLAGLRGSGRTEIFRAIVGIDPFDEGCIKMDNVLMRFSSPSHALKNGIVFLPEDRDTEGLISVLTVRENLVLNALEKVSRKLFVSKKKENEIVTDLVQTLGIKIASPEQEVNQLSGGNKQKVVVGRITAAEPKVFLLDEPTRGIDISAKESILRIISEKLISSAGILITSPGLEDLIMVCDRILVLFKGEIIAQYIRGEYEEGKLFLAIQGVVKST